MDTAFMAPMLQWGLDFIRLVQTFASPPLTAVMQIITGIGGMLMFIILLPLVYWCVDEKKGLHISVMVLLSVWINITLKFLLDQPRPFFEGYDPSLGMVDEHMGGLPSGHAQNTLVLLFIIASWIREKYFKYAAVIYMCAALLCFLIGFSRIYLGVHFPTDVIAGWILGGIILLGYFLLNGKIEALIAKGIGSDGNGIRLGMIASAVAAFVMIIYLPNDDALFPGGTMLGMGTGYCLNRRYVGFKSALMTERKGVVKYFILFARLLLGIAGFLLIYFAAGKLFPQNTPNHNLYGFVRYALGGLWISAVAPWVFVKLRLAGTAARTEPVSCETGKKTDE
uniref:Membrane-associated phospholipid phosphatase n=1 Tax=uncultured bacterium contig00059 TaxID=1181542 RepID=A0A0A6ZH61_9BACT|nr:membrane-associated phospholipid phosphatase [uncultured bacterium contig00059]